jgi:hypothetical protein
VVAKAFKPYFKPDVRHLVKLLLKNRDQKLKNSLASRNEKCKFYKEKYEEIIEHYIIVSKKYAEQLAENSMY